MPLTDPPRAILFDLDDTILDTTESATRLWRQTARAFAGRIGRPAEAIDAALDATRLWYWADPERNRVGRLDLFAARLSVIRLTLEELGVPDDAGLAEAFADHYNAGRVGAMAPFPGAIDTLEHFAARGVPMALLTNGKAETQREKVERFGLARYFRAVLIEGEIGFGKPDRRVFDAALDAVGPAAGDPAGVWAVGDNLEWEVAAPQRLGMVGVWVDWAGAGLPRGSTVRPDRTVRAIAELMV